jgi:hypothetical protein
MPGYNPVSDYISEIWKAGSAFEHLALFLLALLGGIFLIFSAGLYLEIKEDKFSCYNLILLTVFSLSLIFLGVFPCYGSCKEHGFTIHLFFTIIACGSIGFSPLLLYFVTKKDKRWINFEKFNLIIFFSSLILLILYVFFLENYRGLFQRLYFFVCFFWVELISIKLFKLSEVKKLRNKTK